MDEQYYVYLVKKDGTKRKVGRWTFNTLTEAEKFYHKTAVHETDLLYISLSWGTSILEETTTF